MKYDVIIVGAGVAGLYCALHLPSNLKVLILCKGGVKNCNTAYAQGGISVALNQDDVEIHIKDTLNAGSHLNDIQALQILSSESLKLVDDLQNLGISVDRDQDGEILYAQEGGHSRARIVHFGGDESGAILHSKLLARTRHLILEGACVVDLVLEEGECKGVIIERGDNIEKIESKCVVLASGGVGGLYAYHTNASTITADLHGIILKKGLKLLDMEMMQFHPTAYIQDQNGRNPLISEAVRGAGGRIVDESGRRFLFDYDEKGELAPRDILSRAIFEHSKKGGVFLDLSGFDEKEFVKRFPSISKTLHHFNYQIPQDRIPIFPAFHYCMGGIAVDLESRVVGTSNLYAIGECANLRIHGANRLASNSLLEGLIFGKRVAGEILKGLDSAQVKSGFGEGDCDLLMMRGAKDAELERRLKMLMWERVGIIRTRSGLMRALSEVEEMRNERVGWIFGLRVEVAREIIIQALERTESLGAHFVIKE